MTMRYFEVRTPRADFTGRLGPVSFADGTARVQFDDTREGDGRVLSDEHQVSPGRSLVAFARRRSGYVVTELDAQGVPLEDKKTRRGRAKPAEPGPTDPPPQVVGDGDQSDGNQVKGGAQ